MYSITFQSDCTNDFSYRDFIEASNQQPEHWVDKIFFVLKEVFMLINTLLMKNTVILWNIFFLFKNNIFIFNTFLNIIYLCDAVMNFQQPLLQLYDPHKSLYMLIWCSKYFWYFQCWTVMLLNIFVEAVIIFPPFWWKENLKNKIIWNVFVLNKNINVFIII